MANERPIAMKQTSGAGQFAEVHMRIEAWHEGMADPADLSVREPVRKKDLPGWQTGLPVAVSWAGSIDSRFERAIKKGVMSKMAEGPLTGYSACRDIRASIYDGKCTGGFQ